MDLQEEYFVRRKVPSNIIKYPDQANLILRAKKPDTGWSWLQVNITCRSEANHPAHYQFTVSANPVIYASADFSHFSYHHTKVINDYKWEWDQYEQKLLEWLKDQKDYIAVPGEEAVFVSWEMFVCNYDLWFANFLPVRVTDWLYHSMASEDNNHRLGFIKKIEDWMKEKHDRVFVCWKNIRQNLEPKSYADWLVALVNNG